MPYHATIPPDPASRESEAVTLESVVRACGLDPEAVRLLLALGAHRRDARGVAYFPDCESAMDAVMKVTYDGRRVRSRAGAIACK
jgi:hypothetical protein